VGGLLSPKIGGPSVFPPQPAGIWDSPYSDEKWVTSTGEDHYRRSLYTFIRRTSPYPSLVAFDATSRENCTVRRVRTNTPLQALTTLNDEAFFEAARALATRLLAEGGDGVRDRAAFGFRLVTSRRPNAAEVDRIVTAYEKQLKHFAGRPAAAASVVRGVPRVEAGASETHPSETSKESNSPSKPSAVESVALGTIVSKESGHTAALHTSRAASAADAQNVAERAAWTMVANALLNLDEAVNK
jgi:hypothetical protein